MITTFFSILLTLDGLVYNIIDWLYDIFVAIATIDVFSSEQETINKIVTNVYVILGVVMLFALAYSLLRAVINPENFSKGDTSFSKLMQNIVVSIIIIAILPTCFNFAYKFQTSILENDTIPKILFGDSISNPFTLENTEDDPEPSPGRTMAYSIFNSFLHVDYDKCAGDNGVSADALTEEQIKGCSEKIALGATGLTKYIPIVNIGVGALNSLIGASDTSSFFYYDNMVRYGKYGFVVYSDFTNSVVTGGLYYMWFFSTVVGCYVAYVLLNFVFDIALRFIKMLFFEIIAPIPVICRIIPGGKMKDVFSTWLKKVISVYLEVFIRVFVIVIGLYLILLVNDMNLVFGTTLSGLGILQRAFARVIIILGIVTFIRQAPKLICDLFHIDSGGMKLGIAEKLAAGGALTAASTIGGAFGTGGRNLVGAVKNIKNAKSGEKLKAGLSGLASVGAGALSGGARGFYSGWGAKNFKDMSKASGSAVTAASAAKEKREAYKASHKGANAVATMWNVAKGHVSDIASNVSTYFGVNSVDDLIQDNKNIDNINSKKKALRNAAEELILGESNKQGVSKKFGLTGYASINGRNINFDTAILRSMRQAKDVAIASGASNASVLQDEYDQYLKKFTDAVQNQALLGNTSFASMISAQGADARNVEADLGAVRTAASELRRTLSDNLSAPYVADIGFNHEMLDSEHDLNLKDPAMDALGDTLKIAKNNNNAKINELNQKASSGDSK